METTPSGDLVIRSDMSVLGRIWVVYAVVATLVAVLAFVVGTQDPGPSSAPSVGIGALVVWLALLVFSAALFPWWWIQAGRSGYEIRDGQLSFIRRGRVVEQFDCDRIFLVRLEGRISWRSILLKTGFGTSDFPRVRIRTDIDHLGPPILLRPDDAIDAAQRVDSIVRRYRDERVRRATEQPDSH